MKNRVIFDFGSSYFTIFADGKVLLREPTAIIIKKSIRPVAIAIGDDAVRMQKDISGDELFVRPVKKGAVAHKGACTLLIKGFFADIFGKIRKPSVCVLIGCGLNPEQKNEIERVFIDAGIADVYLMESLLGLNAILRENKQKIGVIIGGETTEIGMFEGGKIISGYSIDIGSNTVNERIMESLAENYKLTISEESAEELKKNCASLYNNDLTKFAVIGADSITGRGKKIVFSAKDIHQEVVYVYGRILKVIDGVLLSAPISLLETIQTTGIYFAGYGSLQEGLRDYFARTLQMPVIIADDKNVHLAGASVLANDEAFLEDYLKLGKK